MRSETDKLIKGLNEKTIRFCLDCEDPFPEHYMVKNIVWAEAGFTNSRGVVCIDCIEKRLGRELGRKDFTSFPINKAILRIIK